MPTRLKRPQYWSLLAVTHGHDEQAVQGDWRGHMERAHRESCKYRILPRVSRLTLDLERRALRPHLRRARRAAHPGLRGLCGGQQAAGEDGVQHRGAVDRGLSRAQ